MKEGWSIIFKKAEQIGFEGDRLVGWIPQGERNNEYQQLAELVIHLSTNSERPPYYSKEFDSVIIVDGSTRNKSSLDSSDFNSYGMQNLRLTSDSESSVDPIINNKFETTDASSQHDDQEQLTKKLRIDNEIAEVSDNECQQRPRLHKRKGTRTSLYKHHQKNSTS